MALHATQRRPRRRSRDGQKVSSRVAPHRLKAALSRRVPNARQNLNQRPYLHTRICTSLAAPNGAVWLADGRSHRAMQGTKIREPRPPERAASAPVHPDLPSRGVHEPILMWFLALTDHSLLSETDHEPEHSFCRLSKKGALIRVPHVRKLFRDLPPLSTQMINVGSDLWKS